MADQDVRNEDVDEEFPWFAISTVVIGLLAMAAAFFRLVTTG